MTSITQTVKPVRSLDTHLDRRNNNFTLIRLIAALMVIYGHCLQDDDRLFYWASGRLFAATNLAMPVFFFTSGLLIMQSRDKSISPPNFLWRRFLRLYPAAIFVILTTALLMGPLVTSLPLGEYFSSTELYRYLSSIFLWHTYSTLPGVFTHSALGSGVNPPLWSLSLELKLYLAVFLLGFCRSDKIRIAMLWFGAAVLAASGVFAASLENTLKDFFGPAFALNGYSGLALYFVLGCLSYEYRHRIVIHKYWLALLPLGWWLSMRLSIFSFASFLLLPLIVLLIATAKPLHRINPRIDLSYGIYVWAYPLEQLIVNYLHPTSRLWLFFLNLSFGLVPALISWYFIESKALRYRSGRKDSQKRKGRPEKDSLHYRT